MIQELQVSHLICSKISVMVDHGWLINGVDLAQVKMHMCWCTKKSLKMTLNFRFNWGRINFRSKWFLIKSSVRLSIQLSGTKQFGWTIIP
jgi:hypothetical protein